MKKSVAVAKQADTKKKFSPATTNSILRARNEPKRQLGSLRGMISSIRHDGGTPSVDSILTQLSTHTVQRASVLLGLQQTHGNRYVQRQANDKKEKLPIHAKTITPIRTLKVQRQKVEGFGFDFGQVRIHHDETETAHALKARAFTLRWGRTLYSARGNIRQGLWKVESFWLMS